MPFLALNQGLVIVKSEAVLIDEQGIDCCCEPPDEACCVPGTVTFSICRAFPTESSFYINGDHAETFTPGVVFDVVGSIGNDGAYTVVGSVLNGPFGGSCPVPYTQVIVAQAFGDATNTGQVVPRAGCQVLTTQGCADLGGFQPGQATCLPDPCPEEVEACCLPNFGGCILATPTDCVNIHSGTVPGQPTCAPDPCPPEPTEACCLDDGTCIDVTVGDCAIANGTPQGPGTLCSGVVCPPPPGCGGCNDVDCAADGTDRTIFLPQVVTNQDAVQFQGCGIGQCVCPPCTLVVTTAIICAGGDVSEIQTLADCFPRGTCQPDDNCGANFAIRWRLVNNFCNHIRYPGVWSLNALIFWGCEGCCSGMSVWFTKGGICPKGSYAFAEIDNEFVSCCGPPNCFPVSPGPAIVA